MRAGVIRIIKGKFSGLESFHSTTDQDGTRFTRSFQVKDSAQLDSGGKVYLGEAAIQEVEEVETVLVSSDTGEIDVGTEGTRQSKYTEFLVIPGEIMIVSNGSGTFAFDLLPEAQPGVRVERAELDLNAYAERYYRGDNVNPWQVGFYGNIGEAEKGVVYGDDVFSDRGIGEVLERSQLNQLGLEYEIEGQDMKVTMSESGYVGVYNPSNIDSDEYADYVLNEIVEFGLDQ